MRDNLGKIDCDVKILMELATIEPASHDLV